MVLQPERKDICINYVSDKSGTDENSKLFLRRSRKTQINESSGGAARLFAATFSL